MIQELLTRKASFYTGPGSGDVKCQQFEIKGISLSMVRDKMLDIGDILEEDLDNGVYVGCVPCGLANAHKAILACGVEGDAVHCAACAEGSPFAQRDASEALRSFEDALMGHVKRQRPKHGPLRVVLFGLLFVAFVMASIGVVLTPIIVGPAQAATERYNDAVEQFNAIVPLYNEAVASADVGNVRGFVIEAQELSAQSTDAVSIWKALIGGNSVDKIEKDTESVRNMKQELEESILVINEINCPDEQWVIAKLESVEGIDSVKAVSRDNDPNSLLNREGGYTSCVYFTSSVLGDGAVFGDGPVAKGTDGGGAVEVYPTVEDARARCEYLSGFDDTILYSGSYALVGTMVIRTSCLLDGDAQYKLTDDIVKSMTSGER